MAQEYVVCVDGEEVKTFTNEKDAEDFRKSVAGSVKNVEVKPGSDDAAKLATQ